MSFVARRSFECIIGFAGHLEPCQIVLYYLPKHFLPAAAYYVVSNSVEKWRCRKSGGTVQNSVVDNRSALLLLEQSKRLLDGLALKTFFRSSILWKGTISEERRRKMFGKALLTLSAAGAMLGPFIADFNETHVLNPRW